MSRNTVIFLLLAVALISLSVLPLRRGRVLNCDSGVYERARVVGFPFVAYEFTGEKTMICVLKSQPTTYAEAFKSSLDTAALWFDLILNGAVIMGAYYFLEPRKATR